MKATIKFLNDWTQTLDGDLVQGGELAVDYDLSRLPARRDTFRGAAVWDILALARFQPDGQILAASVTAPVSSSPGGMTVDRSPAVATFPVPGDAAQLEDDLADAPGLDFGFEIGRVAGEIREEVVVPAQRLVLHFLGCVSQAFDFLYR